MNEDDVKRAILVVQQSMTAFAKQAIQEMCAEFSMVLEQFQEAELLVNITEHVLVPTHMLLSREVRRRPLAGARPGEAPGCGRCPARAGACGAGARASRPAGTAGTARGRGGMGGAGCTVPMRARSSRGAPALDAGTSSPSTLRRPWLGASAVPMTDSSVVLPAPDAPVKKTNSPRLTSREMSCSAYCPAMYDFETWYMRTGASPIAAVGLRLNTPFAFPGGFRESRSRDSSCGGRLVGRSFVEGRPHKSLTATRPKRQRRRNQDAPGPQKRA